MKIHIGVDKDSGLIHSVETTSATVHDITQAENLLHGEEKMMYGDAGYQGVAKRPEMQGKKVEFRTSMRHGKRKQLPDTPEGHLDEWCERAKSHIRAKVEHPFLVIKRIFGFQKTRLRGMAKNRNKVNVLAALANLYLSRGKILAVAN